MTIKVEVSANWKRWAQGFAELGDDVEQTLAKDTWDAAMETFYSYSQDYVHVLSGDLKASGEVKLTRARGQVVATLQYDTEYALFEHQRGGNHAFMTLAWQATEETFADALGETWEAVVNRWR